MERKRISYVIVTDENEWVATGRDETPKEVEQTIEEVRERLGNDVKLILFETVRSYEV